LRANVGLAKAIRAETVEIKWPSGQEQVFHNVEADKFYLIEEGRDRLDLQMFVRSVPSTRAPVAPAGHPADRVAGKAPKKSSRP
jgi:hypothetical protein